jgi:hypothetical protein
MSERACGAEKVNLRTRVNRLRRERVNACGEHVDRLRRDRAEGAFTFVRRFTTSSPKGWFTLFRRFTLSRRFTFPLAPKARRSPFTFHDLALHFDRSS